MFIKNFLKFDCIQSEKFLGEGEINILFTDFMIFNEKSTLKDDELSLLFQEGKFLVISLRVNYNFFPFTSCRL
jgi:hypothetical protein